MLVDLRSGQHAHTLQPQDHEAVADGDDEDGHDEGEDEHADLQQGVPVPGGVGENQLAVDGGAGGCGESHMYKCLQVHGDTDICEIFNYTQLMMTRR